MSDYNPNFDNDSNEEKNNSYDPENFQKPQQYSDFEKDEDRGVWSNSSTNNPSSEDLSNQHKAGQSRRQSPYQYNPNTGWQQQNNNDWNYQNYDPRKNKKKTSKGLTVFTFCIVGLLVLSIVGTTIFAITTGYSSSDIFESSQDTPFVGGEDEVRLELGSKPEIKETIPVDGKLSVPQIAEKVGPSVVGVSTYINGRFFEPMTSGSGIIISESGYVVTNEHVVADGTDYKVQLFDGTPYDAELIGMDKTTDLAVLKINAPNLVPAAFGDSDQIKIGELAVAIGNPSGIELAGSVTQGIISAVNREIKTPDSSFNYIQTDAAINPGNSGGALVNEYGQVVGINSAKILGFEGIGFAIPITSAKPIIDDLISNRRVTGRAMLGITSEYTVDEADSRKYDIPMGVVIKDVYVSSDLYGKDVQKGDILTHVDGERIYDLPGVTKIISEHKVGDVITITLYRQTAPGKGSSHDVDVTLVENM